MKVAIVQSNYIPWKGYFDLISSVDLFIYYDETQYTKRDWRNRNQINTPNGLQWLSIPVSVKGKFFQKISETLTLDHEWRNKHLTTLIHTYKKAPHFEEVYSLIEPLYTSEEVYLSKINQSFIQAICNYLGITTQFANSSEYLIEGSKTEKLLSILMQVNATHYISGPAAKDYIEEHLFEKENIALSYFNYGPYPEYQQMHGSFDHFVSILDLLFVKGKESRFYIFDK